MEPLARSLTRRRFLDVLAGSGLGLAAARMSAAEPPAPGPRKKVAIIVTEVRKMSHGQHFVDRFLEGYGWEGRHYRPSVDVASLYVDQFPDGDLSRERSARHHVPIYPSIAEALTLGGGKLAVDGVLIIGEHGSYPKNEKGQTLYPRYRFFKEVVKVFESSGRAVPVFNDKHLSTEWKECVEMVEDARRLGFAFLAGSSLPVTWRIPAVEVPLDAPLEESLSACYGGVDSYDFHGYETAQCMSERRAGGETGLRAVQARKGTEAWDAMAGRDITRRLLLAALARSHTVRPPPGYSFAPPSVDWYREACPEAIAFFVEHLDGFRTTVLLLNGLVGDFVYAGQVKGGEVISCQMHLPMPYGRATTANFFNPLSHHIESTVVTGRASYPAERTLITSGMTMAGADSLHRGGSLVATPEMKVAYRAPAASNFWRS
jgi:hypothetical protein